MKYVFLGIYFLFGAIDCWCDAKKQMRICKPFLIPSLLGYYCCSVSSVQPMLVGGLLFGWIGDLILLAKDRHSLRNGILCFLLGHLCYCVLFTQDIVLERLSPWAVLAGVIGYGYWILRTIRQLDPNLKKNMKSVVKLYVVVIAFMSFLAFLRIGQVMPLAFLLVWYGSLFFCFSDHRIACREFLGGPDTWIMETYLSAQLLITAGYILIQ